MSTDTDTDTGYDGYDDGPSWRSEPDPEAGSNYYRNERVFEPDDDELDPPARYGPVDDDDELDQQVDQAYGEQGAAAAGGPGTALKWAVGGAAVVVTALGAWVFFGPIAAFVPVAAGVTAAGARARRRGRAGGRGRGAGTGDGRGRGSRGRGAGGGRGRAGGAGGGRRRPGTGAGAGGGRGRGRPAGAGAPKGTGAPGAKPKGAGAPGAKPKGAGAAGAKPKGAGSGAGAGRRKALAGTSSGPLGKLKKALGGGPGGRGRGGAGPTPGGRGRGGAGPTGGAGGGRHRGGRGRGRGRRGGQGAQQGAGSGGIPPRRTMRQRAARVGGDFTRGLWTLPTYPVRQAYRGARAGARAGARGTRRVVRRAWSAAGPTRLRQTVGARVGSMVARRRARLRINRRRQQRYYLHTWWPQQGRRLLVPARWVRRHVLHDVAYYRRRVRRGWQGTRVVGRRLRRVWGGRLARVRRFRPSWWVQLANLAAVNGRGAVFMMALTALAHGVAKFFEGITSWALHGRRARRRPAAAPQPTPRPAPQPAPAGPTPRSSRPGATARPRPATRPPVIPTAGPTVQPPPATAGAARPAAGGAAGMAATQNAINIGIPGGIHPSFGRVLEASYKLAATWKAESPVDLHVYLESQPYIMPVLGGIYSQFGSRMAATFPRFTLVHSFFATVANGLTAQQGAAHALFRGWEELHSADLARFRSPDVNERYSDVARWGVQVPNVPVIGNGFRWHANHTVMMEVTRTSIGGLQFGGQGDDMVLELLGWLNDMPLFFDCLCRHTLALCRRLIENNPVEVRFADFFLPLARGYLGLAGEAEQLVNAYRNRVDVDVKRRERPRPNEAWFDFSNQHVTAA